MKKITILGLMLLGLGFISSPVLADIIPDNMHDIDRCSYVTNLSDFPDIYMIEEVFAMGREGRSSIIKTDTCLKRIVSGSIHSEYFIVDKEYFDSIGKENFNTFSAPKKDITELKTDIPSALESDRSSLTKETINYLLVKDSEGKFSLEKNKVISSYKNGKPNKIETFVKLENGKVISSVIKENIDNDVSKEETSPIKKGFWHRLVCFFGLSKNCQ